MDNQELKSKVVKGIIYNFSGSLLKNGITFIISVFLSRILNPSDFGLIGMVTVFVTLAQGLSDLGLSSGLIKEKEPTDREMSSVFFFNIGISIVLTLILYFSAGLIAKFYNNTEIEMVVKAISFTFILNSLNNVHQTILYKNLELKISRISSIISAIISGIVGLSFAYYGFGVWSLVYSTYASSITAIIVIWYSSSWRPSFVFKLSDIKNLMPFGLKVFFVFYIDQIYTRIDIMIIGKIFTPSTLGYYFRASSLNQLITKYSSQGLGGIFFPAISKLQGDIPRIIIVYKKALNAICFLSFFISGFLFLNANEIIVLLFTSKWIPSVTYFQILAFSSYAFPLTIIFNGVLLGTGNAGLQLKLEIIKKLFGLLGLIIGFYFGLKGYLWSIAFTATIGLILSFSYIKKILGISINSNLSDVYKYLIPLVSSTMAVLMIRYYIGSLNSLLLLFISGLFYTIFYFYLSHRFKLLGYSIIYANLFSICRNTIFLNKAKINS